MRATQATALLLLCLAVPASLAEDTARDPVCGMRPRADASVTAEYAGKTYSFCCDGCRKLFVADPQQYLNLQDVAPDGRPVMAGVPVRLVVWCGAALLLASFVVFEVLDRRGLLFRTTSYWRLNLLKWPPLRKLVGWRGFQPAVQLPHVLLFALVLYAGLYGTPVAQHNLAPVLTWTIWWAGLIFGILFLGKAWCTVCPWDAMASWLQRLTFWRRASDEDLFTLNRRWPQALRNIYPATILFVSLTWLELGWGVTLKPAATAYLGVLMLVLVALPAMLFERKAFCRYGCLVGRISGLYALFSPTEVRPASEAVCRNCTTKDCLRGNDAGYPCPTSLCLQTLDANTYCTLCTECVKSCPHDNVAFNLRPFAADLLRVRKPRPDEAWLALVLLSMTAFHGLTMTPAWRDVTDFLSALTGLRHLAAFSVGMGAILLALPVVYLLFIWLSRFASRAQDVSLRELFLSYAYALLPVALFYHLAHNSMHFFMEGQNAIPVLSDPLGRGWDLLGTAGWKLGPILSMPVVWKLQVALIATGHLYGLFVAHGLSRALFPDRRQRLRSHAPMVALMLLMSSVSLWLVSQPMEMRTGL